MSYTKSFTNIYILFVCMGCYIASVSRWNARDLCMMHCGCIARTANFPQTRWLHSHTFSSRRG